METTTFKMKYFQNEKSLNSDGTKNAGCISQRLNTTENIKSQTHIKIKVILGWIHTHQTLTGGPKDF